jgi:TRAP transporter TAXI family solute receptor
MKKKKTKAPPVATVAKALSALRSFIDGQDKWGVRELGVALDMPPSTVHRLLARFLLEGFVSYDKVHQKYSVGFEFTRLAAAVMQRHGLGSAALPIMRELTDRTGEGVWLALFDQEQHRTAYIAETKSTHALRYSAPLGRSMQLSESACGIAILASMTASDRNRLQKPPRRSAADAAGLARAETTGFAVMRASEVDSAMMIAAAVRDAAGIPVGSLAIVVPLFRLGAGQEAILGAMVKEAALRLSSQMGAKLLGGASVGSWKDGVGIISGLLQESNPALAISPALGGGGQNLEEIEEGSGAYALTVASSLVDAREGRGQFKRRLQGLRTVMHLSELHFLIVVRADLKVPAFGDLARLRVSPGEQGFSGAQAFEDALLSSPGASAARRKPSHTVLYLDYPEGKRQLDAHSVDAVAWMTTFSNPSLRELAASGATRLVAPDEPTIDKMLLRNPGYRRGTVPRTAFPEWLQAGLVTIAVPTVLVCRADRSEAEVHEVARTIYEQRAVMTQLSSAYAHLTPDFVLDGVTVPVHPGAERYFKSVGVTPRYAASGKPPAASAKTKPAGKTPPSRTSRQPAAG